MRSRSGVDRAYRVAVGTAGMAMLVTGIVLIPYPGPGWLIVFAALAVLGTEFPHAQRVRQALHDRYHAWTKWLHRQPPGLRLFAMAGTGAVVLGTLWMLNTFGLVVQLTGLPWEWMRSPLH